MLKMNSAFNSSTCNSNSPQKRFPYLDDSAVVKVEKSEKV